MFVISFKASKRKILVYLGAVICLFVLGFLLLFNGSDNSSAKSVNGRYNVKASTNEERIKFLSQFGWSVKNEPIEVCDVIIPSVFNETYEGYNEIQRNQGLDLSKYKEKKCKRWTYEVKNHPKGESGVRANLLVYKDKVIGGDISSVELDGFMHGFEKPSGLECSEAESFLPDAAIIKQSTAGDFIVDEVAEKHVDEEISTTARETLAPDPRMPEAPTD